MEHQFSENTDRIDVAYLAHLARIHLTDEEVLMFEGQLKQIIGYVDQMKSVNVDDVEPMAHAVPVQNVLREDEVRPSLDHETVMNNAPQSHSGHFVMPKIIE